MIKQKIKSIHKEFLILNLLLSIYWIVISVLSPFYPDVKLSHNCFDTQTYLSSAEAYFHFQPGEFTDLRTWLPSVFLWTINLLGGSWFIYIINSLFWITSANLIYYSVRLITHISIYRIVAVVVFALNISFLLYSFFFMTEIIGVFLLSLFLFSTVQTFQHKQFSVHYFIKMLLLFSVMALVKPTFWYPFLFILIGGCLLFAKTIFITKKKNLIWLSLTLIPIIFQLTFMRIHHGAWNISTTGSHTFQYYFLAQGIRTKQQLTTSNEDVMYARKVVGDMTGKEQKDFFLDNKTMFLTQFVGNVQTSIRSPVTIPDFYGQNSWVGKMSYRYNRSVVYPLFVCFLVVFIVTFICDFWRQKIIEQWYLWAIGLLFYYLVSTAAISLWAGDRHTAYTIPLWIVLYILLYRKMVVGIKTLIRTRTSTQ